MGDYQGSMRPWRTRFDAYEAHMGLAREPGTAIDVGAGEGRMSRELARRGWTVTAVEAYRQIEPTWGLTVVRERFRPEHVTGFDLGLALNILHHIKARKGDTFGWREALDALTTGCRVLWLEVPSVEEHHGRFAELTATVLALPGAVEIGRWPTRAGLLRHAVIVWRDGSVG